MDIDFNIYSNLCENCKKNLTHLGYNVSTPILNLISSQITFLLNEKRIDYTIIAEKMGYSIKYIRILQNWEHHKWIWKLSEKKQIEILKKLQEIGN